MTAQSAGHPTQAARGGKLAQDQLYRARRQNWVNQLERHALMQPDATALRYLRSVTPRRQDATVRPTPGALHPQAEDSR